MHTSNIIHNEQIIFMYKCEYIYMYIITVNEKNFKESNEGYMGRFRGRKGEGK